jgi:hypothetical protein
MKSFYDLGRRFPPKAGVYAVRMAPILVSNIIALARHKYLKCNKIIMKKYIFFFF